MSWLLDTNILIAMSKRDATLLPRLETIDYRQIILSSVVVAELEYGIVKSARPKDNRRVFEAVMKPFVISHFDGAAAKAFGLLRVTLERRGLPIGPYDMLIAAHALALDATLVTDNVREFSRVEGLKIENWLR